MRLQKFLLLKKRADEIKNKIEQKKGILKALRTSICKEYVVNTIKEAEAKLAKIEEQIGTKQKELDSKMEKLDAAIRKAAG